MCLLLDSFNAVCLVTVCPAKSTELIVAYFSTLSVPAGDSKIKAANVDGLRCFCSPERKLAAFSRVKNGIYRLTSPTFLFLCHHSLLIIVQVTDENQT